MSRGLTPEEGEQADMVAAGRPMVVNVRRSGPHARIAAGELAGRALGCRCAPLACHADVLLEHLCPR